MKISQDKIKYIHLFSTPNIEAASHSKFKHLKKNIYLLYKNGGSIPKEAKKYSLNKGCMYIHQKNIFQFFFSVKDMNFSIW